MKKNKLFLIIIIVLFLCACSNKTMENEIKENKNETIEQVNTENSNIEENSKIDNNIQTNNDNNKVNNSNNNHSTNKNNTNNSKNESTNNANNNITNSTNNNNTTTNTNGNNNLNKPQNDSTNELIDATIKYYCTSDFKLNGNKCEMYFSTVALQQYVCHSGVLVGTQCQSTQQTNISINQYAYYYENCANLGYSDYNLYVCACSSQGGTSANSNGSYSCYKTVTNTTNASLEYYCSDGLTLNGDKCEKIYSSDALYTYTCPNDYTLLGNKCKKNK